MVEALKQAGYDPVNQLYGFVTTKDASYITRRNNAREIVLRMDPDLLRNRVRKEITSSNAETKLF